MSKLSILLLLVLSEFEFGEFRQMPEVGPIFRLIETSAYFNFPATPPLLQDIFNVINGSDDYRGMLKLQYNLNELRNTLNLDNLILNELTHVHNESDVQSIAAEIRDIIKFVSSHPKTEVGWVVREIQKQKYEVQESHLLLGVEIMVKDRFDLVWVSLEEILTYFAPIDPKIKGLAELYELFTSENILHRCGIGKSPQQVLLGLYVDVMKTDIIITEALIFLTLLKNIIEKNWSDHGWVTLTKRFFFRYNAYRESFKRVFDKAAREHRSCDPDKRIGWERGTSFFELERYNQATAFHRSGSEFKRSLRPQCNDWINRLMNKNYSDGICKGRYSDACWMHPTERCNGALYNCFHTAATRCINDPGFPQRYSWMSDTASSVYYGNPDFKCTGEGRHLNMGFGDTCICHCVQGDNKLSRVLSLSDIGKNRVVTAMKLARKENIAFIQIKQGTLQPQGRITAESSSWEPSSPSQASNQLFMLSAPDQGINLDDLQGADDEVLTGIGFARTGAASDTGVKLQVRVTKFNYTEGTLGNESRVISASDQNRTREMLETNNPLHSQLENVATTSTKDTSKKFIIFEQSDMITDAGQTSMPLFDAVPVEGRPASPLGGAGLFHKKRRNYAGFLSLRAIGITIAKYFEETVKRLPLVPEGISFMDLSSFLNDIQTSTYNNTIRCMIKLL